MLIENEIRPSELMDEQARRYANDVARLMRHREQFVIVACPACEQKSNDNVFSKYGLNFVCCNSCETIYANPRPSPLHMSEYYLQSENYAYWNQYIFPASEQSRRERIFKPRVELVIETCQRFGVATDFLLEVGAGFGIFCEEMIKRQLFKRVVAIEPTPGLAATCRERGIETIEKPIEEITPQEITGNKQAVDVIVNFEVIEHLFSPKDFLLQCAKLLRVGGLLILTCPNAKGFDITVLRELSSAVDTEHVNLFNPHSLSMLLSSCGFEVIDKRTPGQLDCELVRKCILSGDFDVRNQPFLKQILIDEWDEKGQAFQQFLTNNCLSSNMMLAAKKR